MGKRNSKKKVKIKVIHSVVVVGTVMGGGHRILGAANGKWNPSLSFRCHAFLIRNRYPFIVGWTEFSSRRIAKPGFKLTTSRNREYLQYLAVWCETCLKSSSKLTISKNARNV